jgi:hypothetical protein
MLAYPPGWTPIETDPGTASVAVLGGGERIDAYLNVTPDRRLVPGRVSASGMLLKVRLA